jgi:hypothetical protein
VITIRSFLHSWLITGFVTRVIRRMPHVEQDLLTIPENLSSHAIISEVRIARSLVFCMMFCRSLFVLFYVGRCISCPSSAYGFWLLFVCLMVFNVTFNNISFISWRSILLVEETGGPGENHRPVTSHWQTLSHNIVHLALIEIRTHIIGDRH